MFKSTPALPAVLRELTDHARRLGWSDAEWSRRSGVPKETLCRLRARSSCDFATLAALAAPLGVDLGVRDSATAATADGRWPVLVDRRLENQLLRLAATRTTRPEDWRPCGPAFFLAGLAVMLASVPGFDRPRYLALAEALHPGASEPHVFALWLADTPLPPSRFVPMLQGDPTRAA